MTKSDIVEKLQNATGLSQKDCSETFESVLEILKRTLEGGESVKISGFGCFEVRGKSVRRGRNPQTGADLTIAARRVLAFRPSNLLKRAINCE